MSSTLTAPPVPAGASAPQLCAEYYAPLYRCAWLLTGDAATAAAAFEATVESASQRFNQIRCGQKARGWLFAELRQRCRRPAGRRGAGPAANPAEPGPDAAAEAPPIVRAFAALPEQERSALALFSLNLFTSAELAELLHLSLPQLGATLARGRGLLRDGGFAPGEEVHP